MQQYWDENRRENAGDSDGKGTHCALDFPHFERFRRSDGVRRCADGDALGYRVFDFAKFADKGGDDAARDSRDDNGGNRDGGNGAEFARKLDAHRNCDGFRKKGNSERRGNVEEFREKRHQGERREASDRDADDYREKILFETFDLFVKGNRQHGGHRREKNGNVVAADIVSVEIDSGGEQKSDDENARDEHGIANRQFEFLAEKYARFVSDDRKDDSEKRCLQNFIHVFSFRNV